MMGLGCLGSWKRDISVEAFRCFLLRLREQIHIHSEYTMRLWIYHGFELAFSLLSRKRTNFFFRRLKVPQESSIISM